MSLCNQRRVDLRSIGLCGKGNFSAIEITPRTMTGVYAGGKRGYELGQMWNELAKRLKSIALMLVSNSLLKPIKLNRSSSIFL